MSAKKSMFSAEEIHNLVAQVQDLRGSHEPEWPTGSSNVAGASHDDRTLGLSEDMATQGPKTKYWRFREPSIGSLSSDSTDVSGFDAMSVAFSDSTADSIPEFEGNDTAFPIPCEFRQYRDCPHTFNTISGFISHCIRHHRRPLPKNSICWHCDTYIFSAPKETPELQERYFLARLRHIGEHYLGEMPGPVRPDHFVLKHLRSNGLISGSRFRELNICEDRRVERMLQAATRSPSTQGRCEEHIGGPEGRPRREARQDRRGSKNDRR
ncbi:hypothetical protein CC79DRAFT_1371519 [Sarocladium strictum]